MPITFKQPTYMNVPPGVYEGTLTAVEDIGTKDFGFGPKQQVKLIFKVTDAQGNVFNNVWKDVTNTLGAGATLLEAGTALLNGGIPKTADDLIGKSCQVIVGLHPSKNGQRAYSRIDSFLPSVEKTPAAAPRNITQTVQRLKQNFQTGHAGGAPSSDGDFDLPASE